MNCKHAALPENVDCHEALNFRAAEVARLPYWNSRAKAAPLSALLLWAQG